MATAAHDTSWSTPTRNWGWVLARGILAIALGIVAILFPLSAALAATLIFAAYALVDGIAALVAAVRGARGHKDRWGSLLLRGLLGLAVGILFLVSPWLATFAYAFVAIAMMAAWAIVGGILEIVAAMRLRREIRGEWLLALAGLSWVVLGVITLVFLLRYPLASLFTLGWVFGAFALFSGVALVILAFKLRRHRLPSAAI